MEIYGVHMEDGRTVRRRAILASDELPQPLVVDPEVLAEEIRGLDRLHRRAQREGLGKTENRRRLVKYKKHII